MGGSHGRRAGTEGASPSGPSIDGLNRALPTVSMGPVLRQSGSANRPAGPRTATEQGNAGQDDDAADELGRSDRLTEEDHGEAIPTAVFV